MIFTFFCGSDEVALVLRKMDACEVLPFPVKQEGVSRQGHCCRLTYADDTLFRELAQWAAAAFLCGLIASPRIKRM